MELPTSLKNILNNSIVEQVRVEYKTDWNPKTILQTICAFANDIDNFSGGYIIIGVEKKWGSNTPDKRFQYSILKTIRLYKTPFL